VRLSRQELAEHAFAALLSDLSDQPQPRREYTVETHLVIRESTCRVR
jgi:DNA-binding LacI/PurR family transcriptional regulator